MRKSRNPAAVIALLLVGVAGVYGLGMYLGRTPEAGQVANDMRRAEAQEHHEAPPAQKPQADKKKATILTPKAKGEDLSFEASKEEVPAGTDPMVFAVNRFFQTSHILPSSAKVLSVEVKDGTAFFDCTEAADKTFGALDERTLIQGVAKTLQQFHELKKFQFLVSGKPIETWGGVDMASEPLSIESEAGSTSSPEA